MNTILTIALGIISAVTATEMPYSYQRENKSTLMEAALAAEIVPFQEEGYMLEPKEEKEETISDKILGEKEIQNLILHYSAQYAVSAEEMTRVMMCESSGKADAIGDNGLAFGLFQFHENTFNLFSKELGEKLDWKNPEHQIKLASWSFANGKQRHWTCWKII